MTTNEVVNAVSSGETTFGITSFVQHDPTLEFRPLMRGRIVAAMPKDHALVGKLRLRWADLRDHALISTWKGAGIRMVMDVDLARARDRLSPLFEVQQMYTALRFVEEGLGVAPVPDFFLGSKEYQQLHVSPLFEPHISIDLGAIISRRHKMTTMGKYLLDAIVSICAQIQKV
jgi:DNA-binding transcriptional LysR family regulator